MSRVTDCVLVWSCNDVAHAELKLVNEYFGREVFVSIEDADINSHWYIRTGKVMQANIAIAAINHLNLDALIKHLKKLKWLDASYVQLFVNEEEAERWKLIEIK